MRKSDFYYELPERLIAQEPVYPRDSSRLLAYSKADGRIEHRFFSDIGEYLRSDDLLVVNNTRVLPARLYGKREGSGGAVELLLLKRLSLDTWEVMVRPGRRLQPGCTVGFGADLSAEIIDRTESGGRIVRFSFTGVFEDALRRYGVMPLPPYIRKKLEDGERYNTVYAKREGSAAAPTAGLHFTDGLLAALADKGVERAEVTLNVGLGTFRPVKADEITDHVMHSEYYEISAETAEKINAAKREGRRVIAVGTTSVRVLESAADADGGLAARSGDTDIFIYPPYRFKVVDGLITNFHLPESTLIMLVAAFTGFNSGFDGLSETMRVYAEAIKEEYRFFSFGDATLIL